MLDFKVIRQWNFISLQLFIYVVGRKGTRAISILSIRINFNGQIKIKDCWNTIQRDTRLSVLLYNITNDNSNETSRYTIVVFCSCRVRI